MNNEAKLFQLVTVIVKDRLKFEKVNEKNKLHFSL